MPEKREKSSLKKKIQTYGLWLVVAPLVIVFALQFGGPQAQGCSAGTTAMVASIYNTDISIGDLRAAYLLAGVENIPSQQVELYNLKSHVLHGLIERCLLAREAREIGFAISEEEILQEIAEAGSLYLSMSVDAPPFLPSGIRRFDFSDSDGHFSKDNLRRFIQYRLRRSIKEFALTQIEEALAKKMRDMVGESVQVGEGEVWDAYVQEQDKATIQYIRFSPSYYRDILELEKAQIEAWYSTNKKKVDDEYERKRSQYKGLEKQVRARHILIKTDADASEEEQNEAKTQAMELLERVKKGEDFATLAREYSQDKGSARKGGDLGYNPRGRMVPPFDKAQFSLQLGQISDLVKTDFGYHIIKVEGIREGDVEEEEAKKEIAENLLREEKAVLLSQQAAKKALSQLQKGVPVETLEAELQGRAAPEEAPEGQPEVDSKDSDPLAPQFRTTRAFGRTEVPIHGPFDSRPLTKMVFEMTEKNPLPQSPVKLGEEWIVFRLESRVQAEKEKFTEEERDRVRQQLLEVKKRDVLANYVHRLKRKANAANQLSINSEVIASIDRAN